MRGAPDFTIDELMVATISRQFSDATHIINGAVSFIPVAAIMLARLTHAPNLTWLAGAVGADPQPPKLPGSTLESVLWQGCVAYIPQFEDFWSYAMRPGLFETFCVRGAQIDMYGNCNNSAIGPYNSPKVRLPGAAGLGDMGSMDKDIIIWTTQHNPRTLVKRCDFRTFAGWLDGGDQREMLGLKKGPMLVVTDLCTMDFEPGTHRMRLKSVHPGVTVEQVQAATGFELVIPDHVPETEPPTGEQVRLLRTIIDPDNVRKTEFRSRA